MVPITSQNFFLNQNFCLYLFFKGCDLKGTIVYRLQMYLSLCSGSTVLAMRPWANYLKCLSLSFHFCKMEEIIKILILIDL